MTNEEALIWFKQECEHPLTNAEYDVFAIAIKALEKINKLSGIVEGTIDHLDYDDAMDMLYELKMEIER